MDIEYLKIRFTYPLTLECPHKMKDNDRPVLVGSVYCFSECGYALADTADMNFVPCSKYISDKPIKCGTCRNTQNCSIPLTKRAELLPEECNIYEKIVIDKPAITKAALLEIMKDLPDAAEIHIDVEARTFNCHIISATGAHVFDEETMKEVGMTGSPKVILTVY